MCQICITYAGTTQDNFILPAPPVGGLPISQDCLDMGQGKKGGEGVSGGYKGVRAVRPESVAGGGWFEMLWNLECPVGLSQREIYVHFNQGNLAQFRQSAEK